MINVLLSGMVFVGTYLLCWTYWSGSHYQPLAGISWAFIVAFFASVWALNRLSKGNK